MLALAPLFLLILASPDSEAIATVRAPTPPAMAAPAELPAPSTAAPSEQQIDDAVGVGEAAPPPPAIAAMLAPKPASVRTAPPAEPTPER